MRGKLISITSFGSLKHYFMQIKKWVLISFEANITVYWPEFAKVNIFLIEQYIRMFTETQNQFLYCYTYSGHLIVVDYQNQEEA